MKDSERQRRIERKIEFFTNSYRHAKGLGYNVTKMGLPSFDAQEDHDKFHPDQAGQDYRDHNEFIVGILEGLLAKNVPARLVTVQYADFEKWLRGRPNNSSTRSGFCGHLVSEEEKRQNGKHS